MPDEKFRDKVYKTMSENLTTFKRETGGIPSNDALAESLSKKYEQLLGKLEPKEPDQELLQKADQLMAEMNNTDWLYANDRRTRRPQAGENRGGCVCHPEDVENPGWVVIRVTAINRNGKLNDVHISGDFFFFPF